MDTISWIANFIPWWVWPLIAAALVIAFLPYIAPVWAMLPRPVKAILIAVGGLFTAYWAGRNRGSKDERDRQKEADAHAVQKREEKDREIDKLDQPAVDRRLDKWMRD